jgi:hypothetical protein
LTAALPKRGPGKNRGALQSYLISLAYLHQEAKRDRLEPVAQIMWNAMAAIETWLDTRESPVSSRAIMDSSLCNGLDFILKWLSLRPDQRRLVASLVARYENDAVEGRSGTTADMLVKRQ